MVAEPVDAAVDVGVVFGVDIDQRVDHLLRALRGGGVVEIDERLTVGPTEGEDGKIVAQPIDVERFKLICGH